MTFVDLFNELMQAFALFVSSFFELEIYQGVTAGWLLVALSVMSVVIWFMFGRLK